MATSDSSDAPGGGQVDERLAAVEEHLGKLERLVEVVSAIRADVATISEGVDPPCSSMWPTSTTRWRSTACCWGGYSTASARIPDRVHCAPRAAPRPTGRGAVSRQGDSVRSPVSQRYSGRSPRS